MRKCQGEISRLKREWEKQIDNATKLAAVEQEKIDKELLNKLASNYDSIEKWRANYDRKELEPLRKRIAEIRATKTKILEWMKKVCYCYSLSLLFRNLG